jgi:hypothetical protein
MLSILRILLIEQDPAVLQALSTNLLKTIPNFEREDVHMDIIECLSLSKALKHVTEDGDIQAVMLSWGVANLCTAPLNHQFFESNSVSEGSSPKRFLYSEDILPK